MLKFSAKVRNEGCPQVIHPAADRFEAAKEKAQHWRFFDKAQPANQITMGVQPFQAVDRVFDVRERKDAPWQRQAEQLHIGQGIRALCIPIR
jgi:hypothetical protein